MSHNKLMIGQTISHYKILEKIGEGGMGEVYLAEDTELHRKVAIKFLPAGYSSEPEVLARFKREAQAAAALSHPNIITIHEVAEHDGRPYIVMAYVEGEALSAAIARRALGLDKVLDVAIQIAEGLGRAHHADVVHRDIKPDNILIDRDGHVRILDFGLAKLRGVTKLTKEASTLGTVYYMSPEQARNSDVDHRSDIFSLGAVIYEMVTGRLPFEGDHAAAVSYAIANEEPQPLARYNNKVSPELEHIVAKALAKDPGERYQSTADLLADLRRERRLSGSTMSAVSRPVLATAQRRRGTLKIIIPLSVVFLAVAAMLIFKPFTFEVAPDQRAVAAENILAIMYFDNMVDQRDEKRLGEIMTNLLITDLSESKGLQVLSSQRLYDILKLEGKEGIKSLDRATSTSVAKRAGARRMLLGSILQVEPNIVVTSQLVEVGTGAVSSSQRVTGAPDDNVFAVADKLSGEIRSDLAVSAATSGARPHTMKVSTESAEAYRYYLEGLEYYNQYYRLEAKESFLKAIEHDSTFAMAYFRLSVFGNSVFAPGERKAFIEKARRYADNVTEREKLWIDAYYAELHDNKDEAFTLTKRIVERYPDDKEAYYVLGLIYRYNKRDLPEAIRCYRKLIEIDPLYKTAYNQLAYVYDEIGDFDQSIWAINKYIELAPDEANPYDSRGDLYATNGKIDAAMASFEAALERKPDFYVSRMKLGAMYRAKRDYAAAEACYRRLLNADNAATRSAARGALGYLLAYQGKLELALRQYDQGIAADQIDKFYGDPYHDKLAAKAEIFLLLRNFDKAEAAARMLPRYETGDNDGWDDVLCECFASSGDLASARRVVTALEERSANDGTAKGAYAYCRGQIALAQGRLDEAAQHFEEAVDVDPWQANRFALARAYQEAGRLSEAVSTYESFLTRIDYGWAVGPTIAATMHYYAGMAYESSGWNDRAIERYEEFLTIWEEADPGIDIVDDARMRLERLRHGS